MARPLATGIVLGILVLTSGVVGCDFVSPTAKVLTAREMSSAGVQSSSGAFTTLEQSIYHQINQYRQSRNLPPLKLELRISQQARAHSQEMASGRVPFGHQGFEQRLEAISRAVSYRAAAENVAYNEGYSDPATQAVQGWLKSAGHLTNIQGQYNLTGIGVAKNAKNEYYFTQIFIRI